MTKRLLRAIPVLAFILAFLTIPVVSQTPQAPPLDKAAEKWVQQTLAKMTIDEKIGQLLAPSINAAFTPTDSEAYEKALHLVRDLHVGALHVFGSGEATPAVMLNPNYSGASVARKGDPFAAAVLINRLQREANIPLLTTADFEGGAGYILHGTTRLPRAMAIAATRDTQLAFKAGQVAASEGRAIGVTVDFYPVVDVNNNPRNPIINIRSFGEDVNLVSEMGKGYMRGIQAGGMLATAKHFPGHGDTEVDTHLGLARINHPRSRLDEVELKPFKALVDAGVDAVMSTHIVLPALDPAEGIPATLSRPIMTNLLRDEMKFKGLTFTDSMAMYAISRNFPNGKAAVMAVKAGIDFVLHCPDDDAAFNAIKTAVQAGEISEKQITESVERILRVKARMGLHTNRFADIAAIDTKVGSRANARVSAEISERALTLLKDDRAQVPLKLPREANILYLSVLDYASGWREGAPSRAIIPALKQRWPNVTAIEITDRTTAEEMDLVRALARRADAVVTGIYVRIASYSGRMDLGPSQLALLDWLPTLDRPVVTIAFGNPYVVSALSKLPAILLGYEFCDAIEVAAARALAGEIAIGGKLPITLPGLYPFGHGINRAATVTTTSAVLPPADLELTRVADSVWVHTSYMNLQNGGRTPSNGLVVRTQGGGVVLVDTAWNDDQTKRLLRLAETQAGGRVCLALVTHAHDDRLGGIRALQAAGIRVVGTKMTAALAVGQGFPAPEAAVRNPQTFTVDGTKVEFFFPGAGHTRDNAVVWFPESKVLFGGCLLKALEAKTQGNIVDADVKAWPGTVRAVARRYGTAAVVVPGHGQWGGPALFDHTVRIVSGTL